ncbi:hypothetical protein DFH06DRAFT_374261 [Mycena polygramma]|nr:hypothetical protein DFH06DRAFT_374261 [Mycena polygramma]
MDGVESTVGRVSPEPRPVSFSPALSPPSSPALSISSSSVTSPQVAFCPPPLASPRISSPLASPPLVSPPLRSPPVFSPPRARVSPSQPPPTPPRHRPSPLTSASYVHRPSVTSSVPRPFQTPRSTTQTTPASSSSGSPHPPTLKRTPQTTPASSSAGSPHPPTLKRKRSPPAQAVATTDDDPILLVPDRSPAPAPAPSRTPLADQVHSPGPPRPPPPPVPTNANTTTPIDIDTDTDTDPAPAPSTPKSKLGLKHLPLLYDTRGDTMYCRSCRRAFPATGAGAGQAVAIVGAHVFLLPPVFLGFSCSRRALADSAINIVALLCYVWYGPALYHLSFVYRLIYSRALLGQCAFVGGRFSTTIIENAVLFRTTRNCRPFRLPNRAATRDCPEPPGIRRPRFPVRPLMFWSICGVTSNCGGPSGSHFFLRSFTYPLQSLCFG